MIKNQKNFKKIILGDFQLQFGQGLIFNQGLSLGKGSETVNTIEKVSSGIKPYTSAIENQFLRGLAFTYQFHPRWQLSPIISSYRLDASLSKDHLNSHQILVSQIKNSGLHRTQNEIQSKNKLKEDLLGFNLSYTKMTGQQFGLVLSYQRFNRPISQKEAFVDLYSFSGRDNFNLSLYGNSRIRQFRIFGEVALSKNSQALAFIGGITGKIAPGLRIAVLGRLYPKTFHTIRGDAFSEGSHINNEEGIYIGLYYKLHRYLKIHFYYDQYRFKWLRSRANGPSKGFDWMFKADYSISQNASCYFQFRKEEKEKNIQLNNQYILGRGLSKRYIIHLDYKANAFIKLRSRIQWSHYQMAQEYSSGIAFFQDLQASTSKQTVSVRFSIFDTKDAENRQYAYEQDLLYNFSIPGLSGKGIRNYIVWKYQISSSFEFGLKLSRTTFYDRSHFSSGLNRIKGNKVTDLKFQSILRF